MYEVSTTLLQDNDGRRFRLITVAADMEAAREQLRQALLKRGGTPERVRQEDIRVNPIADDWSSGLIVSW
jgi:hypothetical protein